LSSRFRFESEVFDGVGIYLGNYIPVMWLSYLLKR